MGEYIKLSKIESLRESTTVPIEYNKRVKSFFKWLKVISTGKESSSISHLRLSDSDSLLGITFSTKVVFYNYDMRSVEYTFNTSNDYVRCASFRGDSKLAAISDDSGRMYIVALPLKSILRRFNAHESSIYTHEFSVDKVHLMTGSDDSSVKYWDINNEDCICTLKGHNDRVRTLCNLSNDQSLWITGCYDGMVRVYDIRCPEDPITTLNHEVPVEHVNISKSGLSLITTSGTSVSIYDVSSGMKLINKLTPHVRGILRSFICEETNYIITASLDGTVKYNGQDDSNGYIPHHIYNYETSITSCDVKSDGRLLTVGLVTGEWLIRHNDKTELIQDTPTKHTPVTDKKIDNEILEYKNVKLGVLDKLIKGFKYQAALDLSLTLTPAHVFNLVELLILRGTLGTAVKGRDEQTILPVLRFITTHLNKKVENTHIILELLHSLLDHNQWLQTCTDTTVINELKKLPTKINNELYQHTILLRLKGLLDLILSQ